MNSNYLEYELMNLINLKYIKCNRFVLIAFFVLLILVLKIAQNCIMPEGYLLATQNTFVSANSDQNIVHSNHNLNQESSKSSSTCNSNYHFTVCPVSEERSKTPVQFLSSTYQDDQHPDLYYLSANLLLYDSNPKILKIKLDNISIAHRLSFSQALERNHILRI